MVPWPLGPNWSAYPNARAYVRENVVNLAIGYVKCSIATRARRDSKDLYAQAARGEIGTLVGVTGSYDPPEAADIVRNAETESVETPAARPAALLAARERRKGRAP